MRSPTALAALLCLLAACGGGDPKEATDRGQAALGSGDGKSALESFEAALACLAPGDPDWLRASVGRCQALARLDPARAKTEFLALARAHPGTVGEQDFAIVVGDLIAHGGILEAIDVVEAGSARFPESPRMLALREQVVAASQRARDPGAMQRLKGLGYVGDE